MSIYGTHNFACFFHSPICILPFCRFAFYKILATLTAVMQAACMQSRRRLQDRASRKHSETQSMHAIIGGGDYEYQHFAKWQSAHRDCPRLSDATAATTI